MTAFPVQAGLRATVAARLAAAGLGSGARLCCALSGGVDSTVLLHVLAALREELGFTLLAAHVNHGLHAQAGAWQAHCAQSCAQLGVALQVFQVEVARDAPCGLEAAARASRHAALRSVACDALLLAHHQDDQAETVLFRLLRGSGAHGAAGMVVWQPGAPAILRPLLGVRRAQIEAAAREGGLHWVEDPSNADPRHRRNALRHEVLPAMAAHFPAAVPALARAAENFAEAATLMDELAAADARLCGGQKLQRDAVLALSAARQRNLLRWLVRVAGGQAPARARLLEVQRQLASVPPLQPLRVELGGCVCCCYRGQLWLEAATPPPPRPLRWRGETELPWCGALLRCEASVGEGLRLDRVQAAALVMVRGRWPGLSMRLAAGRPQRSFRKLCQDAGVPPWLRERLPVLMADGEAVWIAGIGVAAAWQCEDMQPGLRLSWDGVRE